ncbi:YopX family protein [Bacillus pumilus]|uniref:YopX family protein n=1 Tax=Bacillus pumilus TaxID=1408 RepID=UPI001C250A77|nr:YopX family protein [Bacillus pumilus]MBU8607885.1 YopX family protein [Bacillus pumilus]
MREIKFRGSPIEDYDDLNWFEGGIYINQDERLAYINTDYSGVVPVQWESVGQYTGLKDCNGVEIYEGDITLDPIKNIKGVICYDSHQTRYKFVPLDLYHANARNGGWTGLELNVNRRLPEVVGNIYEDRELLTEEQ